MGELLEFHKETNKLIPVDFVNKHRYIGINAVMVKAGVNPIDYHIVDHYAWNITPKKVQQQLREYAIKQMTERGRL